MLFRSVVYQREGGKSIDFPPSPQLFSLSLIYSFTSSTRQSNISQNISMVCVLTLSFRLSRVICAGLILYFFMRAYWVISFSRIVSHSLAYEIITFKPHFLLECYPNSVYNHIYQYRLLSKEMGIWQMKLKISKI